MSTAPAGAPPPQDPLSLPCDNCGAEGRQLLGPFDTKRGLMRYCRPCAANIVDSAREARESKMRVARQDVNAFLELVLRDEKTNRPIAQGRHHIEWHRLCDAHDRLVLWSAVEHGKTSSIAVGRALWAMARDPSTRVLCVSNTKDQAKKILSSVSQYIERSTMLRQMFPHMRPGAKWREDAIEIARPTFAKDPTFQAVGMHGNVQGARTDLLILDDILDYENTLTPHARADAVAWVEAACLSRLTDNGRVILVGTAWNPEDAMHVFGAREGWIQRKFPAIDANGSFLWPEVWNPERIAVKRRDFGPLEFARQILCEARDDSAARFKREWLELCKRNGQGERPVHRLDFVPRGCRVYTGVDLAVARHAAADLTAMVTVLVRPNEDRELLNVESGRWGADEIIRRIINAHRDYQAIMVVENNAAQDYIVQLTRKAAAIPIIPYTTGNAKAHPEFGLESMFAEMAGGKWSIPNEGGHTTKEIAELERELLYYDPRAHVGDRLMALWLAREGFRLSNRNAPAKVSLRILGS